MYIVVILNFSWIIIYYDFFNIPLDHYYKQKKSLITFIG